MYTLAKTLTHTEQICRVSLSQTTICEKQTQSPQEICTNILSDFCPRVLCGFLGPVFWKVFCLVLFSPCGYCGYSLILLPLPTEISPLLREFCGLAKAKALDDATILSLFWHGANSHRPVDLPETTGLSWREGIFRCLESVLTRAGTSLLSSVAHSSLPSAVNSSPLSANL